MGLKSENGENMEWSMTNTKALIEILHERVKKKQLQGSTFKVVVWEDINNELAQVTGQNYGVLRLKGKYNRLRTLHREFSTLLARTGVTWDSESNKVNAAEEVWEDLYSKGKFYKQFKKNGFEYDYDVLGEIFNSSTATGKLSQASTQEPPTSDEEKELENNFLSKGVHISEYIDVDKDEEEQVGNKRKHVGSSNEHRRKEAKVSKLDRLEVALAQWSETMSARTEAAKAKAERYKTQATNPESDPYSVDACMELLDSMEDIPTKIYNNALQKFTCADWRRMFIRMPSFRRKDWLASLE